MKRLMKIIPIYGSESLQVVNDYKTHLFYSLEEKILTVLYNYAN